MFKFAHLGAIYNGSANNNLQVAFASGRSFPIWNTIAGDDKLLTLSIHGRTEQDGTPTPEVPVPLQSVGDEDLYLYVMQDKEGSNFQTLDIKTAMQNAGHDGVLRSVNGIYDEVVYNGKQWKLIQRIGVLDNIPEMGTLFKDATYTDKQLFRFQFKTSEPKNFCASGQTLSNIFITATSSAMDKQPLNSCFSQYARENVHYIYFNAPLECSTVESALEYIGTDYQIYYPLFEPQEYSLDLPQISTYEGQTYFATNIMEIKPRMVAQCQVSEKLDYIKEGLLGYWTGRERSNTDENRDILPDLSGNGNDLTNYNMAYTTESGYGDGYIQYDGIDDFSGLKTSIPATKRTVLFTVSDIHRLNENNNAWCGLIDGQNYFLGISNGTGFSQSGRYIINGVVSNDNFNILDKGDNIYVAGAADYDGSKQIDNITIGSTLNQRTYACKCKIYDVLLYDRILTEEEIEHNYKASQQFNGEDFSYDPVEQSLVASYRAYDKKNEDEDRDVLKDLSGNGHDIQLYNFAFSEGSGYGLYATDFTKWTYASGRGNVIINKNSFTIKSFSIADYPVIYKLFTTYNQKFRLSVTGIDDSMEVKFGNSDYGYTTLKNGINDISGTITVETNPVGFMSTTIINSCNITIEQIPDYQGALVSDGIDDYGLCENFPVFTKEKGYTVCAIRKWLNIDFIKSSKVFLSTRVHDENNENPTQWGSFTLEKIIDGNNNMQVINFGATTLIENKNILLMQDVFTYLNSKKYKYKEDINIGNAQHTPRLNLFAGYTFLQSNNKAELSNIALYALEIYNRDLTDEEIAKVKERMIAEYEEKTGNKYEEENI